VPTWRVASPSSGRLADVVSRLGSPPAATVSAVSERHDVTLHLKIDGKPVSSETTCMWAGPYILAIATVLPDRGLALGVHSSFLGHSGLRTLASHIILGPIGHTPYAVSAEHDHGELDPSLRPRECIYEHAAIVVEALKAISEDVGIDVPDDAFAALGPDEQ
jgi:hypothetical protein